MISGVTVDMPTIGTWAVAPAAVTDAHSAAILRDYLADIAGRYWGRDLTSTEVDAVLADHPSADLTLFLLARPAGAGLDEVPAGCVGFRLLGATAELSRMYVRRGHRGQGCGAALLDAAERAARRYGVDRMRLDTRHDLVEARALYARHGYVEVPPHNDDPYADHWFAKPLR